MRATPLELILMNLKGLFPKDAFFYISKRECLRRLRQFSGRDFGDDVAAWETWMDRYKEGLETALGHQGNLLEGPLPGAYTGIVLRNVKELYPKDSEYYIAKDECLRRLQKFSGRDFGEDVAAWAAWIDRYKEGLEPVLGYERDLVEGLSLG